MKILDPQSAVLTNSEVLSFMRAHPPRKPDPQIGGYPVTDMRGLLSVQREFTDYAHTITPHLLSYPEPPSKYMRTLLQRLHKFNLTKPEVLMMINLGVGGRKTSHSGQAANGAQKEDTVGTVENGDGDLLDKVEQHINSAEGREEAQVNGDGENDIEMQDEQVDTSDASVLSTIVEEMYDRFSDDDINKILKICGEVLGGDDSNANDVREEVGNN